MLCKVYFGMANLVEGTCIVTLHPKSHKYNHAVHGLRSALLFSYQFGTDLLLVRVVDRDKLRLAVGAAPVMK